MKTETHAPARMDTKKLTTLAILAAISYIIMVVGRLPISSMDFLKYDPKDIVIAIGGFIFGPFSALLIAIVVSFVEMVTVSSSGPIGLLMNIIASASFACVSSFIYKKKQDQMGAAIGLVAGALSMTIMMLLWNFFITPMYMGITREAVQGLLLPIFLPFNLTKSGINAALAMLLYKPVVQTLRKARLVPESAGAHKKGIFHPGYIAAAIIVLATCIIAALVALGII